MKKFLKKHVLFPSYVGLAPYFWLLWLFPAVSVLLTLPTIMRNITLILLIIFVKVYRDYFLARDKGVVINIFCQLILAATLSFFARYPFLYIYTGFIIGTFSINMKNAKLVIVPYYVLSTISLYLAYPLPSMAVGDVPAAIINYLFIFGTIPASNSLSKSYRLGKQNNRLELITRHSERDRIAQQLHDNLGQSFSMLALKAELAEKLLEKDPVLAKQQLKDIAAASRQNLDLVREIVADMKHSTILQTLDIQQSNLDKSGIMLHTKNEEITVDWNKDIQNTISQIITELVTNAIRYSHGNLFSVTFSQNKNQYLITVHDNGIGFDKNISYKKSFGLSGIKKRIDYLDGNVNFDNDNGAKIDISIPIVKGD